MEPAEQYKVGDFVKTIFFQYGEILDINYEMEQRDQTKLHHTAMVLPVVVYIVKLLDSDDPVIMYKDQILHIATPEELVHDKYNARESSEV